MFDMNSIGKRISSLRKERGITQMGLADKLGISFQAVSNWERGNTMPDISKLPELSEILGVTIEELLGDERKGKIVEEIAKGETPQDVQADELADVAPILNQEQFNKAYEQISNDGAIDIKSIIAIAPFMDEDVLGTVAKELARDGVSVSDLVELAPFLDEVDLSEIVDKYLDRGTSINDVVALAPFLDEVDVGEIVQKFLRNGAKLSEVAALAPFMDEDDLTAIADEHLKNGGSFSDLTVIAPFLDMNDLFRKFYKK